MTSSFLSPIPSGFGVSVDYQTGKPRAVQLLSRLGLSSYHLSTNMYNIMDTFCRFPKYMFNWSSVVSCCYLDLIMSRRSCTLACYP